MDKVYEHLLERGMNPHLYGVSWDEHEACIPLRDLSGKCTGYLRYRPWGDKKGKDPLTCKYKPTVPKSTMAVFGVETLAYPGNLYVVEGAFKACKLHNLGFAALAVQGSDPSSVRNQVFLLRQYRNVVCIGDNDKAGRVFTNGLGGFTSPRDLDEMTDEEVKELLNGNS
ncbi:MAG: hypothetical protein EOO61_04510 [Hymenobacter sp.]|nr:MAG: hypothetical protein EOO61_04510 [Hymenobacter sp.]